MEYDFENAPDRSHTDLVKWMLNQGNYQCGLPIWILKQRLKLLRQCKQKFH